MKTYKYAAELTDHASTKARKIASELGVADRAAQQLDREFREVGGRTRSVSRDFDEMGGSANKMRSNFLGLNRAMIGYGTAAAALSAGLISMSKQAALQEQTRISFDTMLGSAERAKKVIAELNEFSNVTPFENDQVLAAGKALLAFKFDADNILPTLRNIGNIASGTGKDFNELALIYGKARIAGTLYSDDLNQLMEAGIPVMDEFAKSLGVTESSVKNMASQGRLQFRHLEEAFGNLTSKGGMFFELMEKQSESFIGKSSTIAGKANLLAAQFGESLNKNLKPFQDGAIALLDELIDKGELQSKSLARQIALSDGLFSAVERSNVSQNERKVILDQINTHYADYLDNLLTEKSSLEDVATAHQKVTKAMREELATSLRAEEMKGLFERRAELEGLKVAHTFKRAGIQAFDGAKTRDEREAIAKDFGIPSTVSGVNRLNANLARTDRKITAELAEVKRQIEGKDDAFRKAFSDVFGEEPTLDGDGSKNKTKPSSSSRLDGITAGGTRSVTVNMGGVQFTFHNDISAETIPAAFEELEPQLKELLSRILSGGIHTGIRN